MEVDHARRALATYEALQRRAFDPRRQLYGKRRLLRRRSYAPLWPYANAWSGVATLASLRSPDALPGPSPGWREGLARYRRDPLATGEEEGPVSFESTVVPPLGPGGEVYFDDNAWIGLASCRQRRLTGEPGWAVLARRIATFLLTGWSDDRSWARPGGIRWKDAPSSPSRTTCANGPTAELLLELAELTGEPSLLEWAVRIYEWVRGALLGVPGLYADQVAPDGVVNPAIWSYNQGTMIGAGVLLAAATGEERYLEEASRTARASLERYRTGSELEAQLPAFNAVYFRNLFLLHAARPDPAYRRLAARYADTLWATRRQPDGCFAGPSLLNCTAPMVEIEALLAGAPPLP